MVLQLCRATGALQLHVSMAWHDMAWHGMAWHGMAWQQLQVQVQVQHYVSDWGC